MRGAGDLVLRSARRRKRQHPRVATLGQFRVKESVGVEPWVRIGTTASIEHSYSIPATRCSRVASVCRFPRSPQSRRRAGHSSRQGPEPGRHRPRRVRGRRRRLTHRHRRALEWRRDRRPPTSRPERLYARFRYRIEMEGREVAGASKLSGLTAVGGIVKRPRPGHPSDATSNVRSEYESITIERGITHDREFETWSRTTCEGHRTGRDPAQRHRHQAVRRSRRSRRGFRLLRCWVSEFQAVPDLDANANAVAIEHLKLEHEGWERDSSDETPSEGKRVGSLDDSPEE